MGPHKITDWKWMGYRHAPSLWHVVHAPPASPWLGADHKVHWLFCGVAATPQLQYQVQVSLIWTFMVKWSSSVWIHGWPARLERKCTSHAMGGFHHRPTDGNQGRGLAYGAEAFGCWCMVYIRGHIRLVERKKSRTVGELLLELVESTRHLSTELSSISWDNFVQDIP